MILKKLYKKDFFGKLRSQSANKMSKVPLALMADSDWETTGGFSTSVDNIIPGVTLHSKTRLKSLRYLNAEAHVWSEINSAADLEALKTKLKGVLGEIIQALYLIAK